jgi:hypothetical protein
MSDSTAQTTRQLKIKTGIVKRYYMVPMRLADKPRLFKEEKTYYQEAEQARKRLQKFKDDEADGADIRNAVSPLHRLPRSPGRTRRVPACFIAN